MSARHIRIDLSLLRQGAAVAWEFGPTALEELARIGSFLERIVYAPGSLRSGPDGVTFTLLNPPLRMGAFTSLQLYWNGLPVPKEASWVTPAGEPERPFAAVGPASPVTLAVGERHRFRFRAEGGGEGHQRVRLELRSAAIPPLVWFEFGDVLRPPEPAP